MKKKLYAAKNCPDCGMPLVEVRHSTSASYRFEPEDGTYRLMGVLPHRDNYCLRCGHNLENILKKDIRVEQSPSRFTFGLRLIGGDDYLGRHIIISTNRLIAKTEAIKYFQGEFPNIEVTPVLVELIGIEGNA